MNATLVLLLSFQVTPEIGQHINAGMKAKQAGDLDTAVREFRRVAELAPALAAAHVNLGAVYLAKRDYGDAIPALRKALELSPDLTGAQSMLGTALLAQGYGCESIPHLETGGADDLLGVALLDCGRPREALDRLEAALQKRPGDPDLLYYLGRTHSELAKRSLERLRDEHPDSARTQQMLGEAAAAGGDRAAAEKHLRAAVAARSDLRGAHFAIGELLLQAGEYMKAEAEFRAEARLSPGSAVTAWRLGSVLANLGRTNEAIAELKRANGLQQDMPETLLELGTLLNGSGDARAAEGYLRRVLEIEKDTALAAAAHFQLAQVCRKLGRAADAEREMKAFQSLRPGTRGQKAAGVGKP
jgi:tetratricopeptide (TPR) repeat protein